MSDDVTLTISGVAWGGWTSCRIASSIENGASDFDVELTERYPGETNPIQIRPGVSCSVRVGSDVAISGYVDAIDFTHDAGARSVRISGRSKVGDLVDCSAIHEPGTLVKRTVLQIASALAEPYGVTCVTDVAVGDPLPRFRLETGETVYAAIERAARVRSLLVTDDTSGRLVLTRAGSTRASGALVVGDNVLSAAGTFRADVRFSEYRCKGQTWGDDESNGDTVAHPEWTASDPAVDRTRVLVIVPERGSRAADCRNRARWEAAMRAGQSTDITAAVVGWRQPDGTLWRKGQIVPFSDPFMSCDAVELMIVSVSLDLSGGGRVASMRLVPPEAYSPEPLRVRQASTGGGKIGLWTELSGLAPTQSLVSPAPIGAGAGEVAP